MNTSLANNNIYKTYKESIYVPSNVIYKHVNLENMPANDRLDGNCENFMNKYANNEKFGI